MVKIFVGRYHAVGSELLPRVSKRQIALIQAETTITLEAFKGLRQAVWIIVAEESCGAVPEFAERRDIAGDDSAAGKRRFHRR